MQVGMGAHFYRHKLKFAMETDLEWMFFLIFHGWRLVL